MWLTAFLLLAQLTQAPIVIQGYDSEITVPHGWTARTVAQSAARLEHTSGATLTVTRTRRPQEFNADTYRTAERIANPLGFATIGTPRHFSNADVEWLEYDIRGNRLTDRRRILYRSIRNRDGLTEIIFESPEQRFDTLVREALSIASSQKSVSRKIRVRQ